MRILTVLTYYRPHYSGLTIYAERLARALVRRGHEVTVLTSQYDKALPHEEVRDGVRVVRPGVLLRISKGVIMPAMLLRAWQLVRQADVVLLHLPQLDAAAVALISRLLGKRVLVTYHCDLVLPKGLVHRLANLASNLANGITARLAQGIVQNSQDYAAHSPFLGKYLDKVHAIAPPIEMAPAAEADVAAMRQKAKIQPGQRIIGIAARLATEKGVEYLAQALPRVLEKHPTARVLFAGPYQDIVGEEAYARRLAPLFAALGAHWTFLGVLSNGEFSAFFELCEVTVLPSINPTESYGMVQVESMACGTPVIATDRPGVRVPVQRTGMGALVCPGDVADLAETLIEVLDHPEDYRGDARSLLQASTPQAVAAAYESLFGGASLTPADTGDLQAAKLPANPQIFQKDFLWLHLRDLPYFRAILRAVEAQFYQEFRLAEPVLDLGCGDGHFATLAFDHPLDVGLDPWGAPIREARQRGGYKSLVQADAGQMPFASGAFASAISNSVLEHIPHIDAVLRETCRALQPGAVFIFCVPNPGYLSELDIPARLQRLGLRALGEAYRDWFKRMSRVAHADTPEAWEARLERAGFRLERWWHYFSPQAMRALEWGHYLGAPTLLPHLLTRRWILARQRWNLALTEHLVRRYSVPLPDPQGTFTFYVARKPANGNGFNAPEGGDL